MNGINNKCANFLTSFLRSDDKWGCCICRETANTCQWYFMVGCASLQQGHTPGILSFCWRRLTTYLQGCLSEENNFALSQRKPLAQVTYKFAPAQFFHTNNNKSNQARNNIFCISVCNMKQYEVENKQIKLHLQFTVFLDISVLVITPSKQAIPWHWVALRSCGRNRDYWFTNYWEKQLFFLGAT